MVHSIPIPWIASRNSQLPYRSKSSRESCAFLSLAQIDELRGLCNSLLIYFQWWRWNNRHCTSTWRCSCSSARSFHRLESVVQDASRRQRWSPGAGAAKTKCTLGSTSSWLLSIVFLDSFDQVVLLTRSLESPGPILARPLDWSFLACSFVLIDISYHLLDSWMSLCRDQGIWLDHIGFGNMASLPSPGVCPGGRRAIAQLHWRDWPYLNFGCVRRESNLQMAHMLKSCPRHQRSCGR